MYSMVLLRKFILECLLYQNKGKVIHTWFTIGEINEEMFAISENGHNRFAHY